MHARFLILILAWFAIVLVSGCATDSGSAFGSRSGRHSGSAESIQFALIGDTPYGEQQAKVSFPNLIEELNAAPLAFVVHDGDIKAGAAPCTDESFLKVLAEFQTIRHPLVYTFGDNEWTDCEHCQTNAFAPMERLQKLRDLFTAGERSLGGRPMPLLRQSQDPRFAAFRENVRWTTGEVVFAMVNVPGDDNNVDEPEFAWRNAANIAWIRDAFAVATLNRARAIMLIMQADPHFDLAATNVLRRGFNEMLGVIEDETMAFAKPVVLVHGDSHYFRIDQPLKSSVSHRRIENFTRVETFGNPDVHWVRVTIDPDDPNIFRFERQMVRKNLFHHQNRSGNNPSR